MKRLKEKILNALRGAGKVELVLNTLAQVQDNLLKNYSNPVFNQKDRGKLLKSYTDLQNIVKPLYRFGMLKEDNYLVDAEEEKRKIEDIVLKGGIIYYHYVWHSEDDEKICEECRELDGQIFDMEEEVPERPHPNCRCTVEVVEGEVETGDEDSGEDKKKIPPQPTPQPPNPKPTPKPEPSPQPQPKTPEAQRWILPVPKGHKITSGYGYRMHPVQHVMKFHDGIDINAQMNTPVYAVADGTIVKAEWYNGYGNYIEINHGDNLHSFYGHLSSFNCKKGDVIKQGYNIAKSGSTGVGTAAHLHFGVHKNNLPVNPLDYLPSF